MECPREGCATVQVLASQLEESVEQATQCLNDMTKANKDFLVIITEAKTLASEQSKQLAHIVNTIAQLSTVVVTHGEAIAVLKSQENKGASTATASTISSTLAGVLILLFEWLRGNGQ